MRKLLAAIGKSIVESCVILAEFNGPDAVPITCPEAGLRALLV